MQRKLLQAELWKPDCKNCMIILITIRLEADIWVMFTTAFSLCRLESFRKEKCLENGLKYKNTKKKRKEKLKSINVLSRFSLECKVHGVALVKEIENPKFTCPALSILFSNILNILISNCFEKAFPKINRYPEPPNLNVRAKLFTPKV